MHKAARTILIILILINIPVSFLFAMNKIPLSFLWILSAAVNIPAMILAGISTMTKEDSRRKLSKNHLKEHSEEQLLHPDIAETLREYKTILETIPSLKELQDNLPSESPYILENITEITNSSIKEISAQLEEKKKNEHQLNLWLHSGFETIGIMEQMDILSRKLETDSITDITQRFNEIWERSENILNSMISTADSLYSSQADDGLNILNRAAEQVTHQIKTSHNKMAELEKIMGQFLETSRENLSSILHTAGVIQDIAEQIKVISINMRIEAAKLGSINSGFHVLGQEITKLADRTTETSESTTNKVNRSMEEVLILENRLKATFSSFEVDSVKIGETFNPMKDLMKDSYGKIEQIINDVKMLSDEISHKAKGTMGKLQFSDITGQEMEHRLSMVKSLQNKIKEHMQTLPELNKEEKEAIRTEYMTQLKNICTTENEIQILNRYLDKDSDIKIETDQELEDEGMLLF